MLAFSFKNNLILISVVIVLVYYKIIKFMTQLPQFIE